MKKRYLLLLSTIFSLVGCAGLNFPIIGISSGQTSVGDYIPPSFSFEEGEGFYRPNKLNYTMQDLNSQLGWVTSESIGEQKMLVIPIQLKGVSNSEKWTETKLDHLEKAFFGDSEDTTFESVSSFYYQSSYGQLNITGEVIDVFESNYTISELDALEVDAPNYIAEEFYLEASSDLLQSYDLNNDGFVDNCVFIYSNDYSYDAASAFWAWCSAISPYSNLYKPNINNYMWASYAFMEDGYFFYNRDKVDAHTYIHETGHLLGLDDYYCYDEEDPWDCAGSLEMQSYNVGDHNIYSKMALGWVKPYVITDSTEIKLRTSAKYPEAILIKDDWNGSAFDEYILIEYYTPQGLNKVDSENSYNGRERMYDYNGLRIYHIDARLGRLQVVNPSLGTIEFLNYTDTLSNSSSNQVTYVAASNSVTYSYLNSPYNELYRYVHLLDQGENNKLNNGRGGSINTSNTLWTGNKTFIPSKTFFANDTKFNDGTDIGYSISVSNLTDEDCQVSITKI